MEKNKYKDLIKFLTTPLLIVYSISLLYAICFFIIDYCYINDMSLYNDGVYMFMVEFSLWIFGFLSMYIVVPSAFVLILLSVAIKFTVKEKSAKPLLNLRLWVTIVIITVSTLCQLEVMSNNF